MKWLLSSGTVKSKPLKSKGSATSDGSNSCRTKHLPHHTPSQSEKPPRVAPKFAQKIPLSQFRPTFEHLLQVPPQSHHFWDSAKLTWPGGSQRKRDSKNKRITTRVRPHRQNWFNKQPKIHLFCKPPAPFLEVQQSWAEKDMGHFKGSLQF